MASFRLFKKIFVLSLIYIIIRKVKVTRGNNEPKVNNTSDAQIIYDQRQNGKYNIHVVIKDVAIIELDQNEISDQNYNDDEYYYDENELTVKPLKPTETSAKPLYSPTFTTSQNTILSTKAQNVTTTFSSTSQDMTTFSLPPLISTLTPTTEALNTKKITSLNIPRVEIKSRSKVEPIYALDEKLGIQPDELSRRNANPFKDNSQNLTNSKMFKLKIHHSHRTQRQSNKRCHTSQYKGAGDNCHEHRSSSGSILKRLLNMLITLPFAREQQHSDN